MYEYTYIGQATNAVADPNANSAGVSEDERGGIKPSSDNVLFAGVLSEAHMKLAMIAGVECLFRIASVRYGDNGRSRLVVHTKANGTSSAPMPVDFPLGFGEGDVERDGIFDYDFDVVEYTDGRGNQDAYVLLVSGERRDGDNTLFDAASTSGILSVVRLRISNDGVRVISHTSWRSISRGRLQKDGYHCLQCPRITVGKTLVDGRLSGAYLHRRGTTAEKALGSEAEVALECFTLWSDVSGDSLTFRRSPLSAGTVEHRARRAREYQRQNGGARCIRDCRRLWLCIVRRDRPVHCGLGRYVARCHSTPRSAVAAAHGLFGNRQRATAAYYLDARRIGICNAARGCRRLWPGIV